MANITPSIDIYSSISSGYLVAHCISECFNKLKDAFVDSETLRFGRDTMILVIVVIQCYWQVQIEKLTISVVKR